VFYSSRRRHTRFSRDWSSDVCSSDLSFFTSPASKLFPIGTGRNSTKNVMPKPSSSINSSANLFLFPGPPPHAPHINNITTTAAQGAAERKESMVQNKYEQIARQFLGIPYRHGGRDRNGLDCLGLVHLFYQELGIKLPDNDGRPYTTDWYKKDPERLLRGLLQVGRAVDLKAEPLQPLDLVYFRMGGAITHTGIM